MILKNLKIVFIFTINCFILNLYCQNCKDYHKEQSCIDQAIKEGFSYYGQSASTLAQKNRTINYNAVFYENNDYIINFCFNDQFYPLHFNVFDSNTGELIYDNKTDNYMQQIAFTMENTRAFTLNITLLGEKLDAKNIQETRTCLGVLILWRKHVDE